MSKCLSQLVLSTVLLFGMVMSPSSSEAQLFGADDEDFAKVEFELKKFNAHLENLKNTEIKALLGQQENLLRQIEEILHAIPQLQEIVEQNKAETLSSLNKTNLKINDLEAEVKNQAYNNGSIRAVITEGLIPALHNDNNKTRQSMLEEIQKLKISQNRLEGKLDELLKKMSYKKLESLRHETPSHRLSQSEAQGISQGYNRKNWKHWIDADEDCQDTRVEILIRDSVGPLTFKSKMQCKVVGDEWFGPYTGRVFKFSKELDIDHIVPLKHAYLAGGMAWTKEKKRVFANDPENLLAVDSSANRSKDHKGPDK